MGLIGPACNPIGAMKKASVLVMLVTFGCVGSRASGGEQDVFKWISSHVQTVSYIVTTPLATYQEDQSATVEFSGCTAKVTEDLKTPKSDIRTTTSFDLRTLEPDMIRSSSERGVLDTHVSEYFTLQLPLASPAKSVTTVRTSHGSKTDMSASNSVSLVLPDGDMADRQANAWRDASRACSARE